MGAKRRGGTRTPAAPLNRSSARGIGRFLMAAAAATQPAAAVAPTPALRPAPREAPATDGPRTDLPITDPPQMSAIEGVPEPEAAGQAASPRLHVAKMAGDRVPAGATASADAPTDFSTRHPGESSQLQPYEEAERHESGEGAASADESLQLHMGKLIRTVQVEAQVHTAPRSPSGGTILGTPQHQQSGPCSPLCVVTTMQAQGAVETPVEPYGPVGLPQEGPFTPSSGAGPSWAEQVELQQVRVGGRGDPQRGMV
ncbi:hypothetical protein GDO81_000246 [Engystomops pustulosus]|uniref:Uncharacterized protein n=1 Tax=Engystomops pustulosus TaxID=76066 RepID=A0AAV7D2I3_ENGPU|nr:hypothetical protein GDO81_000246 [Engystomops pustulosus]